MIGAQTHCLKEQHYSMTTCAHYRTLHCEARKKIQASPTTSYSSQIDNSELCSSPGTINHQFSCPKHHLHVPFVLVLFGAFIQTDLCVMRETILPQNTPSALPLFTIVSTLPNCTIDLLEGLTGEHNAQILSTLQYSSIKIHQPNTLRPGKHTFIPAPPSGQHSHPFFPVASFPNWNKHSSKIFQACIPSLVLGRLWRKWWVFIANK